ncbi:adenine deaminase [Ahrensia sp. AH-315-G08]|nr:adenine deaminase [Ahrensia sp. AH-315-G08]
MPVKPPYKRPAPWNQMAPLLVDVAMGRADADLVIKNGRWVNVYSGEIIDKTDLAIIGGRFAYCGPDASHCIGDNTEVIEADGRYLVPGLCDAHMHVESGMVTVSEFCRAVIPHGTTSMFIDPHEIANVLGLAGVRLMHDEALGMPINVHVQMPSCVPSAPGLENAGASLGPADIAEALTWENIIGLGEVMDFPGVAANTDRMTGEIAATMAANKTVGGHFASPNLDKSFHGYVAGGPADDHEGTTKDDAIARVRQGMRAMLRLGSAWYDVEEGVRGILEDGIDPRNYILCTDDSHSGTLINDGHMNRVVKHAIQCGVPAITALQMATINTAQHFGLEREIGSISPGRLADFLIVDELEKLTIKSVYGRGKLIADGTGICAEIPPFDYPQSARNTLNMKRDLVADDFDIAAPEGKISVKVRTIGVIENQAPTKALEKTLSVTSGTVDMDGENDVCQIALVERHRATGEVVNGFVSGFGYNRPCAMASSVAHDSHHMIVVGTSKEDMAKAANRLKEVGGGVTFFADGEEKAMVEMPIAGLMSDEPAEIVAQKAEQLTAAMAENGCNLNNAYMQHSLLALVVIPELRISDIGLVDVRTFEKVDLFID